MTYKDALIKQNTNLGSNKRTRFIGYGLKKGRALGTLLDVPDDQIIEMPVAENLMMGCAIGLSLKGYLPVVFIERMDFIVNGMDAMVNHLDKAREISDGEYKPAAIIRCVVGNTQKPLYTGATHVQDFSEAIMDMVSFPVFQLKDEEEVNAFYQLAYINWQKGRSTMLVEYKDLV